MGFMGVVADQGAKKVRSGGGRTAVRLKDGPASPSLRVVAKPAKRASMVVVRRGDEVRGRVLQAALECFGAFGFEGTSTRAVAERAEVTHTLVLYHFHSKDQLWIATVEHALERYGAELKVTLERAHETSARKALAAFIGPTVCDDDGPRPILKRSKTLIMLSRRSRRYLLLVAPVGPGVHGFPSPGLASPALDDLYAGARSAASSRNATVYSAKDRQTSI